MGGAASIVSGSGGESDVFSGVGSILLAQAVAAIKMSVKSTKGFNGFFIILLYLKHSEVIFFDVFAFENV
jgi:hypothetical protein